MGNSKCNYIRPNGKLCRNPADFEVGQLDACDEHLDKLEDEETYYRSLGALQERLMRTKQSLCPLPGHTQVRKNRGLFPLK